MRVIVVSVLCLLQCTTALNVLVYLTLVAKSHLHFASNLVNKLIERGHTVDVVLGRLNSAVHSNGSHNARHVLSVGFPGASPWNALPHMKSPFSLVPDQESTFVTSWAAFNAITAQLCPYVLNDSAIAAHLDAHAYDVALVSNYDGCPLALLRKHGIRRVLTYSSLPVTHFEMIHSGIPTLPSIETDTLHRNIFRPFDHANFAHRLRNFVRSLITVEWDQRAMIGDIDKAIRSVYGAEFPSISDLGRAVYYELPNSHSILEEPRLLTHRIKYIGGIAYSRAERVRDEAFLRILNETKKGVVLISFGSQVFAKHYPEHVLKAFLHAIRALEEYTFVWKYDGLLPEAPANLHLVEWMPQNDLLQDARVIAFVSHMGMNSFLEAAFSGVPLVAIPLFGDQTHNGLNVARLGNGIYLSKRSITDDTLLEAISAILTQNRYRERGKQLAAMLASQPDTPERTFIETVEFAAQVDNLDEMTRVQCADLHTFQALGYDIVVTITVLCVGVLYAACSAVACAIRRIRLRRKQKAD